MKLPKRICVGPNQYFPVIEKNLIKGLGYVDIKLETIFIEQRQPIFGKFIILLHEMIHIVDIKNTSEKLYKKRLTEDQVTYLAGGLFPMLVASGLIKNIKEQDLLDFQNFLNGE